MSQQSMPNTYRNKKQAKFISSSQQQNDEESLQDVEQFYLTSVNFPNSHRKTTSSWKFRDFKSPSSKSDMQNTAQNFFKKRVNLGTPFSSPKSIFSSDTLPGLVNKANRFQGNSSQSHYQVQQTMKTEEEQSVQEYDLKFKQMDQYGKNRELKRHQGNQNNRYQEKEIISQLCTPIQFFPIKKEKADLYFEKAMKKQLQSQRQKSQYDQQQEKVFEQRKYHEYYKNQDMVFERNIKYQMEDDLDTVMLRKANNENLLPRKLNIISNSDNASRIKIKHYLLGNRYSGMFSTALTHQDLCEIQKINVQNNNLNHESFKDLINSCPQNIVNLNFKQNKINPQGCEHVEKFFQPKSYEKLTILNLEKNNIQDKGFSDILINMMKQNQKIKKLNVSNNLISDTSMPHLSEYLKMSNSNLCELYLHWNKITPIGGTLIAEGLKENKQLIVIDISHNCLGSKHNQSKSKNVGVALIESLSEWLKHLDLSFNEFSTQEGHDINDALIHNKTLYGFHFEGNSGIVVDERGFLKIPDDDDLIEMQMMRKNFLKKRIKGIKTLGFNQMYKQIPIDVCWICDGWVQHKFVYNLKTSGRINTFPVFLHLDFEDFSPILMGTQDEKEYISYRMIPPNKKVTFFFSNPLKEKITHIKNTEQELIEKVDTFRKPPLHIQYIDGTVKEYSYPSKINYIEPVQKKNNIINNRYEVLVNAKPRDNGGFFQIEVQEEWTFPISLFHGYKVDHEEILTQCFEFDWKNSKMLKLIKNEDDIEPIKEILKSHYKNIKANYKMYAALGMVGDVFAITQNGLTDFISKQKTILDQYLKLKDIDINFIMTNQMPEQNPRNPQRGLVRFQFMEILFRLSQDKYVKSKKTNSQVEALQLFLDEGLTQLLNYGENYQYWRDTRYWIKEVDYMLKDHLEFLTQLYNRFSGTKREKSGYTNLKYLNYAEFKDLIQSFSLTDDWFGERDIPVSFNLAMMTQVDELTQDRFMQMSFIEFLEAFSRVAEKLSPIPLGENPEEFTDEERIFQPLHMKLETMIQIMQIKQQEENNDAASPSRRDKNVSQSVKLDTTATPSNKSVRDKQLTALTPTTPKPADRYQLNRRKSNILHVFSSKRDDAFSKLYGRTRKPSHLCIGGISFFGSDVSTQNSPSKKQDETHEIMEEYNKEDDISSKYSKSEDSSKNSESEDEVHTPSKDNQQIRKSLSLLKKQQSSASNNEEEGGKSSAMAKILNRHITTKDIENKNRRTSILTGITTVNQKDAKGMYNKFLKPLRKQSIFQDNDQII